MYVSHLIWRHCTDCVSVFPSPWLDVCVPSHMTSLYWLCFSIPRSVTRCMCPTSYDVTVLIVFQYSKVRDKMYVSHVYDVTVLIVFQYSKAHDKMYVSHVIWRHCTICVSVFQSPWQDVCVPWHMTSLYWLCFSIPRSLTGCMCPTSYDVTVLIVFQHSKVRDKMYVSRIIWRHCTDCVSVFQSPWQDVCVPCHLYNSCVRPHLSYSTRHHSTVSKLPFRTDTNWGWVTHICVRKPGIPSLVPGMACCLCVVKTSSAPMLTHC